MSLTDLVEVLGIIGDTNPDKNDEEIDAVEEQDANGLLDVTASDAAKKFVADVASVEFSSPELVDVSRVDSDTTVGQIKEKRGLECEYSAELTEEQIAEFDAQTIDTGDWALISLQPFTSEEALTVTMKNGEIFTIRVTDSQLHTDVITDSGESYRVTVTYDKSAQIPENASLKVKQYSEDDPEYQKAEALLNDESESSDESSEGILVFDISIYDESDKLIEPQSEVSVKFELLSLPEEADEDVLKESLSVYHIVEDNEEEIAVPVADTGILSEGSVSVDMEANKAVAEFVTDSFSIYTVKWGNGTNQQVRLHFVNESGQELTGVTYNGTSVDGSTITIGNNNTGILNFENGILDLTDFQIDGYTLSNTHKSTWEDLEGSYVPDNASVGWSTIYANYPHTIIGNELRWYGNTVQYKLYYANSDKAGWYWFDAGKEPTRGRNGWMYNYPNGTNHDPTDHTQVDDNDAHPYDYYLVYSQNPSGSGSGGSDSDLGDIPEIGHTKEKTSNYDGTYNLELGVSSEAIEKKADNHINVVLVVDTSSSMRRDYANDSTDYGNDAGTNPRSRIYQTRQAVTGFVSDLMKQNETDPGAVEMELITFNMGASVYQGWTDSASVFNGKVNNMPLSSGTNWAEALKLARSEALLKNDGDPTYVLFLTDGAPSQYWDPDVLGTSYYVSGEGCYLGARDEARAAARDGVNLYTIFSYGTPTDQNNDYLGKLTDYAYNSDSAKDSYRFYAGTGTELKEKLKSILNTMEEKHFGAGDVQINDGITELTTVTFEHIDPESFQYSIIYKDYTDENDPTVFTEHTLTDGNGITVSGSGSSQTITIPSYTYRTWQNDVYKTVTTNEVTIKGAVFTDSPDKKVTWKLEKTDGKTYILEDNWTYNVKFKIWPSQDSYDLLAALNNGFLTWGQDFVNGDHTIPASEYREQIDNTVSPYALKTNTVANVTYKKTTSTTVNGETTYQHGDPITVGLPTVDGMPLDNTRIVLEKKWNSTLTDEDQPEEVDLYILIDPTPEKIAAFNAAYESYLEDPTQEKQEAFEATYYYKAALNADGSWKQEVSIAPGVYDQYGHMNTTGHTYMVMEPAIDGHYELEATPTHPMLNGLTHDENDPYTIKDMVDVYGYELSSLDVDDPDSYPPTYEQDEQLSSVYSVANTLKAGINIRKELVDVTAAQQASRGEFFTVKVTLEKDGSPVYDTMDGGGSVGYRIYAPADKIPDEATVIPAGASGDAVTSYTINGITYNRNTGNDNPGFTARGLIGTDGTVTLKIRECDSLRIVNVPMGTTYTAEEIVDSGSDFKFKETYWEVMKEGAVYDGKTATVQTTSTTQVIVPDAENNVVFRNTPKLGSFAINKSVTYNGRTPTTDAEKQALAGTYTFKVFTDENCTVPYKEDGVDKEISIIINADGAAQTSGPITLPVGQYWIEEQNPGRPGITPDENRIPVTITKDTETSAPAVEFVNNGDYSNDPDELAIDLKKTFSGLTDVSQIPANFQAVLTYNVSGSGEPVTVPLTGTTSGHVTCTKSEDGMTWQWHVTHIPSNATDFAISESHYDVDGYTRSTTINGDTVENPENPYTVTLLVPVITMTNVTRDYTTADNAKVFTVEDNQILLVRMTNHATVIVSQKSLGIAERTAIEKMINDNGGKIPGDEGAQAQWVENYVYFSHEIQGDSFSYGGRTIFFEGNTVKIPHKSSSHEVRVDIGFSSDSAENSFVLTNDYSEVPITIDIEKVQKDAPDVKLPGAVFTLRQIADKEPVNGDDYSGEEGTEPQPSDPTAEGTGRTSFTGLTSGYYELKETTAPNGYILSTEVVTYFKVEAGVVTWLEKGSGKPSTWSRKTGKGSGELISFTAAVKEDAENEVEAQNAVFTVENIPGAALPSAGGPGTLLFTILGNLLILGAGILIWRRRRLI